MVAVFGPFPQSFLATGRKAEDYFDDLGTLLCHACVSERYLDLALYK